MMGRNGGSRKEPLETLECPDPNKRHLLGIWYNGDGGEVVGSLYFDRAQLGRVNQVQNESQGELG